MFEKEITTKDGIVRTVRANSEQELAEAIEASIATQAPENIDITIPGDNPIVSPESLHTEPAYQQPADPGVEETTAEEEAESPKEEKKLQPKAEALKSTPSSKK